MVGSQRFLRVIPIGEVPWPQDSARLLHGIGVIYSLNVNASTAPYFTCYIPIICRSFFRKV